MKRSAPPKRKAWIPRRRATPRRSGRVRDSVHLAIVRSLSRYVCGARPPNDPDHLGQRGLGRKADDDTCAPMCRRCHDDRHALRGPFRGFTKERLQEWKQNAIDDTRGVVAAVRRNREHALALLTPEQMAVLREGIARHDQGDQGENFLASWLHTALLAVEALRDRLQEATDGR